MKKLIIGLLMLILMFSQVNTSIGFSENMSLKEVDKFAEYILNKLHYVDFSRIRRAGVLTDPRKEPNYEDIINQLHRIQDSYVIKATVYEMVGYDNGVAIVYILEHYDEWQKMKKNKGKKNE